MTTSEHDSLAPPSQSPGLVAYAWPLLVALAVLPIAGLALYSTFGWSSRPFPGFFMMQNAVVPTVTKSTWTGVRAGLPFHAQITTVDGVPVDDSDDVYDAVAREPLGHVFHYTLVKGRGRHDLDVASMSFGFLDWFHTVGLMLLFGVASIMTGLFVATAQPRHRVARVFLYQTLAVGLFGLTGPMLYQPSLVWVTPFHFLTQATFPATFVHFGLVFPRPRAFIDRRPGWLIVPYALSGVLTVWIMATFFGTPPDATALHVTYGYAGVAIAILIGLHVEAMIRLRGTDEGRQVRPIVVPILVGTGIACFGFLNTARGGGDFPINYVAVTPIVYFGAIGYSILRYGLFDVNIVIRRLESLNQELESEVARRARELERAQAHLLHSEKLASLGQLVAGVAHEINNPVSFITANVVNLRRAVDRMRASRTDGADDELTRQLDRLERMCALIESGATRTAGIVTDLRTFSRIDEPLPTDVDVHENIDVSLRLLEPRLRQGIRVHRSYGPLPSIRGVAGPLNQVFMNVLGNACDAVRDSGNVWIDTTSDGTHVVITIRDDGPGIPADVLPRVFDPFFSTRRQGEGTGLGLSISHGIVTSHGGTIEAASPPGGGAVFTIRLPIRGAPAPDAELPG